MGNGREAAEWQEADEHGEERQPGARLHDILWSMERAGDKQPWEGAKQENAVIWFKFYEDYPGRYVEHRQ